MSPRPPRDAAVALRSLPRRFRGVFAGLGDDESPEALAVRPVADGTTALGHLVAATRAVAGTRAALERVLQTDDPKVDALTVDASAPGGTLEERLSELGWETDGLADVVDRVAADAWGRRAMVGGTLARSAADLMWEGVDAAVDQLKTAERTLAEARQAR